MSSKEPKRGYGDWYHIIMQNLVLDRFVWAHATLDAEEIHYTPKYRIRDLPEAFRQFHLACRHWQGLIADVALNVFDNVQSEVDEGSVNVANRTVFTELGHRLADVDIQARKSIIEGNFLAAALGLRALVAVSTATSLYICLF